MRDAPSIVLPHQDADFISHIALDIGGSLIKLIYFSHEDVPDNGESNGNGRQSTGGALLHCTALGGTFVW